MRFDDPNGTDTAPVISFQRSFLTCQRKASIRWTVNLFCHYECRDARVVTDWHESDDQVCHEWVMDKWEKQTISKTFISAENNREVDEYLSCRCWWSKCRVVIRTSTSLLAHILLLGGGSTTDTAYAEIANFAFLGRRLAMTLESEARASLKTSAIRQRSWCSLASAFNWENLSCALRRKR